MLLKILLLQVMSIGLILLQIEAQDAAPDEMPELFMTDMDKMVMGKIWNIAGFSNGETGEDPQVERRFFKKLLEVAPQIAQKAQPFLSRIPYLGSGVRAISKLAPVVSGMLGRKQDTKATQDEPIDIPDMMMPYPVAYPGGLTIQNNQQMQQYRVQPKPPNSELDSLEEYESPEGDEESPISPSRRRVHPENTKWEVTADDDDHNDEETEPRDLESEEPPLERIERMTMGTNTTKDTPMRTLKIRRLNNHRTTLTPDVETIRPHHEENTTANKNSQRNNNERKRYMHKKKYYRKTANATRNASKRKESNRKPDKSLERRKYYDMLENSQKNMCKCNMNEEKHRRQNEEMNGRKLYMERSMDQVFNCTKYCTATEGKDARTNDKPNGRLRSRHDKDREQPRERYNKMKRENQGEDMGEEEAVRPRKVHSRRHRNKHRNHEYEYSTSAEAEEMVNDEDDKVHLPDEHQFAQNAEYRSSIDPVEAYAEESAYRHRYPDEREYHPAKQLIKRHVDETDYMPRKNVEYSSIGDALKMNQDVQLSEYLAWSPFEVLHEVKGYNPMIHQYPYNPLPNMYEQMQDIRSIRNKVTR